MKTEKTKKASRLVIFIPINILIIVLSVIPIIYNKNPNMYSRPVVFRFGFVRKKE
jgi:hypothetical protein